jgi:hypothetical protein
MSGHGQNHPLSGAAKQLASLFEQRQGEAISRWEVQQVADQLDYMKRLRRNGGARDILDVKGIALLWGGGDSYVISKLGLGPVGKAEFISHTPADEEELALLRAHGHAELQSPGFG